MKKILSFVLVLSFSPLLYSNHGKKVHVSSSRSVKKYEHFKLKDQSRSHIDLINHDRNMGEVLNQLPRRYPRNYNVKYNPEKIEQDDFGFAPLYSRQKKSCRV